MLPVAGREGSGWDAPPLEGDIAQGDGDRFFRGRAPIRPPRKEGFQKGYAGRLYAGASHPSAYGYKAVGDPVYPPLIPFSHRRRERIDGSPPRRRPPRIIRPLLGRLRAFPSSASFRCRKRRPAMGGASPKRSPFQRGTIRIPLLHVGEAVMASVSPAAGRRRRRRSVFSAFPAPFSQYGTHRSGRYSAFSPPPAGSGRRLPGRTAIR